MRVTGRWQVKQLLPVNKPIVRQSGCQELRVNMCRRMITRKSRLSRAAEKALATGKLASRVAKPVNRSTI